MNQQIIDRDRRKKMLSLRVSEEFLERLNKIPKGLRSPLMEIVLERIMDAADKRGHLIYGLILDGEFDIVATSNPTKQGN